MDAVTAAILTKSLDGLMLRATANAQNIASTGTPGYRPVRVSFEEALKAASSRGEAAINAVVPQMGPDAAFAEGETMRLDLEMIEAASTTGRYGAVVELLNRHAQITALAISGGR